MDCQKTIRRSSAKFGTHTKTKIRLRIPKMWEGEARGVATFWYPLFFYFLFLRFVPRLSVFLFSSIWTLCYRPELSWAEFAEPQRHNAALNARLFCYNLRRLLEIVCKLFVQESSSSNSTIAVTQECPREQQQGEEQEEEKEATHTVHRTPYTVRRRATKCVHINFIYLHRVGKAIAAGRWSGRRRSQRERGRHTDDDDDEEADLTIQTGCCCCCCWWSNLATIVVVVVVVPVVVGGAVGFSKALTCETWDWDWAWAWSTPGRSIDLDNELL